MLAYMLPRPTGLFAALCIVLGAAVVRAEPLPRFPATAVWHTSVEQAPLHPDSDAMIARLQALGGWGNGNRFQIDWSMFVLHAADDAPTRPLIAWPSLAGYYSPDCEAPGLPIPLPPGGAIEGVDGYACDHADEDCHLLVVQGRRLYEAYAANVSANGVEARCAVVWSLDRTYPRQGRGEQCTSADAAGFPIAPLLFNADEVADAVASGGDLGHAIRFILPNERIAAKRYVHPASHGTDTTAPLDSVPYGVRMRLKAGFDMSRYNAAARAILRTMQRYGIVLSDGGNIALTAENDRYTVAKWSTLGIGTRVFVDGTPAVKVTDFEVVQTGPRHEVTYACRRTPADFVFIDGFDY